MLRMVDFWWKEGDDKIIGVFKSTKDKGEKERRISIQALVKFTLRATTWHGPRKRHIWSVK